MRGQIWSNTGTETATYWKGWITHWLMWIMIFGDWLQLVVAETAWRKNDNEDPRMKSGCLEFYRVVFVISQFEHFGSFWCTNGRSTLEDPEPLHGSALKKHSLMLSQRPPTHEIWKFWQFHLHGDLGFRFVPPSQLRHQGMFSLQADWAAVVWPLLGLSSVLSLVPGIDLQDDIVVAWIPEATSLSLCQNQLTEQHLTFGEE